MEQSCSVAHTLALCSTLFWHSVEEVKVDEFGIEMTVKCRKPAPLTAYSKQDVFVPPVLAKWLRPHQREGVQFMYECVMGLKEFQGNGCILADDMGLVRCPFRILVLRLWRFSCAVPLSRGSIVPSLFLLLLLDRGKPCSR